MLLTGGCSNNFAVRVNRYTLIFEIKCEADKDTEGVWIYDPDTISWLELSAQPLYHLNVFGVFSVVWNDLLLSFGGLPLEQESVTDHVPDDWNGFSISNLHVPAGMTSKNLKVEMCYNCPVGQFSSTSHSSCSQCPDGLTTEHEVLAVQSTAVDVWITIVDTVRVMSHCRVLLLHVSVSLDLLKTIKDCAPWPRSISPLRALYQGWHFLY